MCIRDRFVPGATATDARSLYDLVKAPGSLPKDRRVALDLWAAREAVDKGAHKIYWMPTFE
eukprot:2821294-Alexandrium_andersonii.AAC.1